MCMIREMSNDDRRKEETARLSAAERKRKQREKARQSGKQGVELQLSHDLKAKLEWAAKKEGVPLKSYIADYLEKGHRHIV